MSSGEHYIYFSSKFATYNQILGSFTVNLPFWLELKGDWKCSILEVYIKIDEPIIERNVYILADFCTTSLIKESLQLPILKKIFIEKEKSYSCYFPPLYIPVKQSILNNFELKVVDSSLETILFTDSYLLECTLHFYKDGG